MSRIVNGILLNVTKDEWLRLCAGESFESIFGNNVIAIDKDVLAGRTEKEKEYLINSSRETYNGSGESYYTTVKKNISKISVSGELTSVTSDEIKQLNDGKLFEEVFPGAKIIGDSAFKNNKYLERVYFKEGTEIQVDDNAFIGCINLKEIKIGEVGCQIKPKFLSLINEVLNNINKRILSIEQAKDKIPIFKKVNNYFKSIFHFEKKQEKKKEEAETETGK